MLKLNQKKMGLLLTFCAVGISQTSYADGEIIGSASSIPANHSLQSNFNPQDSYINERISFHLDSLKVDELMASAKGGDEIAQRQLGDIYRHGLGVTKSDVVALMWYTISDENGAENAGSEKDFTARYMAVDQINLAYEMASRWLEDNR